MRCKYIEDARSYIAGWHQKRNQDKREFMNVVREVAGHEKVQEMKQYNHHSQTNCFEHSMHVSYYNYKICKLLNLDARAAARAGLLHDMFLYDWHDYKQAEGERLHGFEHPRKSLRNARTYFPISLKEADMIKKHMFPLTLSLPRYKESYVIVLTDKFCSSCEVMDRFFKKKNRERVRLDKARKKLKKAE